MPTIDVSSAWITSSSTTMVNVFRSKNVTLAPTETSDPACVKNAPMDAQNVPLKTTAQGVTANGA